MKNIQQIKKKIRAAGTIIVAGHRNPDGDSIGSILSLGLGIEQLGKRVIMVSADGVPQRYRHLPGAHRIVTHTSVTADVAVTVDCGAAEMLGDALEAINRASCIIEVDHHEFRRPFGTLDLIDYAAAAVGELVYLLLRELDVTVTKAIAENILTSIIVETNSFRLPNIRALTFDICAKLIRKGVNFYDLVDKVFWSKSRSSALLTGVCLSRCVFLKRGRIVWSIVRQEDFDAVGGKDEDVDPVVHEMRSITGVDVAILFREKSAQTIRVSLRSKDAINIASVAEAYGGGGHFDAAGCSIQNNEHTITGVLKRAERLLERRRSSTR